MQKESNSNNWTVEEWRAENAPKVATAVERELATLERELATLERARMSLERASPPPHWLDLGPAQRLAETKESLARTKEALAETLAKRAKTLAKHVRASVLVVEWAQALAGLVEAPLVTYDKIVANSKLMDIIYSIEPDHRLHFAYHLWPHRQNYWWLIQILAPITRLPQELLHQIFLIIIDEAGDSPFVVMRVSKLWYNTVTGIWASLKLGTMTPKDAVTKKLERNQWFLDVVVDTEIDRGHFTPSEDAYQAIFAAIEATSRWRSLVLETFPAHADLPEDLVNRGLQQCTNSIMNRLRTFKIKFPCERSPLLDHLLRVLGTSASEELATIEINSANVIPFLVPTYSSIFRSVTVLTLDTPGLSNPVDLLPHLHQLESLTASHLPLPVYDNNDADLPFIHTLRHLKLRSVSIQWMSGRTFRVLETCTLTLPIHHHVLDTFCATLPNCKGLTFEGYPLDILNGIVSSKLDHLSVMCSSSYKPRGNRQLARFSSQALRESRLAPRFLHISVEATSAAWIKALDFMSNLEELVIHNAEPSSLGAKVLESLVVEPVNAYELGNFATPRGWNTLVCPSLRRFGLRYRRWLRPSEHFDLIPVFMSIIRSREQSNFSLHSFRIWTGINQKDPWELIENLSISFQKFEHLKIMVSLKDEIINLPLPYDDLSALSPVVQSEVLNGELLRRVRETKEVGDDEIEDIVQSMMELSLDQIVCSLQDRNTFLGQIENARQARQPQPLLDPVILICKNLDLDIDSNALFAHFRRFGQIVSARVMRNEHGLSRGFGFVSFQSPNQATRAMHSMNGATLGTKQIVVQVHAPKQLRKEGPEKRFGGHNEHPRSHSGATSLTSSEGGSSSSGWPPHNARPKRSSGSYFHVGNSLLSVA